MEARVTFIANLRATKCELFEKTSVTMEWIKTEFTGNFTGKGEGDSVVFLRMERVFFIVQ